MPSKVIYNEHAQNFKVQVFGSKDGQAFKTATDGKLYVTTTSVQSVSIQL